MGVDFLYVFMIGFCGVWEIRRFCDNDRWGWLDIVGRRKADCWSMDCLIEPVSLNNVAELRAVNVLIDGLVAVILREFWKPKPGRCWMERWEDESFFERG